jgi:hypothetical protein
MPPPYGGLVEAPHASQYTLVPSAARAARARAVRACVGGRRDEVAVEHPSVERRHDHVEKHGSVPSCIAHGRVGSSILDYRAAARRREEGNARGTG